MQNRTFTDRNCNSKMLSSVKIHGILEFISLFSINNPTADPNPNPTHSGYYGILGCYA